MKFLQDDSLHEECGVIGVYREEKSASRLAYYGLFALQHRGQECAGIAVNCEGDIEVRKGMGLVADVFDETALNELQGNIAIGHVRYSTAGDKDVRNAQPLVAKYKKGDIGLAHNGNLVNAENIREILEDSGVIFHSTTDTESILNLIARYSNKGIETGIKNTMSLLKGAYALVLTTGEDLIGIRDPHGLRPLCIGKLKDGYVFASESCALDVLDAEFIRDVEPGEIVVINKEGLRSIEPSNMCQKHLCVFELIYFARPDSVIDGDSVYDFRVNAGRMLAKQKKIEADMVMPVPDSGVPSAIGYAKESGIPYGEGLVKNRYIGRTFIQPTQEMRENAVKIKLSPLKQNLEGKRVVMIDDSIVRGTTCKRIVEQVRKAGAKEIHVCITSPPVQYSCYFGIDTPYREFLIGAQKSVDEICEYLGADSLTYLSEDGLREVCNHKSQFCKACFNGKYPMEVPIGTPPSQC
ncbi:amidophosphoribosyltransferase [Cellulosilyticum lentocellum]|uniref:Amidophosphoribosyltransferase n=1 Tax=Cellulosilyticum lentocellum (strain ATCC 49066 / DSM 5427 / NCIMB 11756 / RHM5) TaxID=642492 RepID=F2JJ35_CELLD|nr:amidophosphoribosyltransferase [Cellulosilyticum lentocellum]ADZ83194.1 amidophosphoribosyltransferase [Cellulosilyticum lentocellum DSM 5427]